MLCDGLSAHGEIKKAAQHKSYWAAAVSLGAWDRISIGIAVRKASSFKAVGDMRAQFLELLLFLIEQLFGRGGLAERTVCHSADPYELFQITGGLYVHGLADDLLDYFHVQVEAEPEFGHEEPEPESFKARIGQDLELSRIAAATHVVLDGKRRRIPGYEIDRYYDSVRHVCSSLASMYIETLFGTVSITK